jgi:gliding motility-associated-like protein
VDTDGDGVTDDQEITDGTDPNDPCEFVLAHTTVAPSTDWLALDCDNDNVTNEQELEDGQDTDSDGTPNYLDPDDDGDTVPTFDEDIDNNGTPLDNDTDGDTIPNYLDDDDDGDGVLTIDEDVDENGTAINDDTDGDNKSNYLDIDDDDDGILTIDELGDLNGNGIPDYLEVDEPEILMVVNDTIETGLDLSIEIEPLENDETGNGEITVSIVNEPVNGTITFDPTTGVIVYTPNNGYVGEDSIIYRVCNSGEQCENGTIFITLSEIISPPQIFTPNGNGQNDNFVIKNLEKYSGSQLSIFNRWGSKVFESNDYRNNWSGYANTGVLIDNKPLPTGTYYYLLRYGKNKSITGFIYLKR